MPHLNCISKLLNLQALLFDIDNISENENQIIIPVSTKKKEHICPCCGMPTSYVHDYRIQYVKDIPFRHKIIVLKLRKRRYVCNNCGKRFFEHYDFLPKYYHSSNRLFANILYELQDKLSFKTIAKNNFVSTNTVSRALKLVHFTDKPELPEVLGIDEFKGNCNSEKYQVQLTDIANQKTLDILFCRKKAFLHSYFNRYSLQERQKVKYFVIDMWNDYKSLSVLFPNAKVIVDKYHYVRQVFWALDGVRKRIQKDFFKPKRIFFKKSRYLLFKNHNELEIEECLTLENMLNQNETLKAAWKLKELFYDILHSKKRKGLNDLINWLEEAENAKISEFENCIKSLKKWRHYIAESLQVSYTNAYTEGKHNLIKTLKRNAFGFRNFEHMRKRLLLCS